MDNAKAAGKWDWEAVRNMHRLFLEALRHREQEIIKYVAILVPALAGFVWLLKYKEDLLVFCCGTVGVILALLLGAIYALALGYNYRYITLQLAKFESDRCLGICQHILNDWHRSPEQFAKEYVNRQKPRCDPPEIIKVSWIAFLIGIGAVTLAGAGAVLGSEQCTSQLVAAGIIVAVGSASLWYGICGGPRHYGRKMRKMVKKELGKWKCGSPEGDDTEPR